MSLKYNKICNKDFLEKLEVLDNYFDNWLENTEELDINEYKMEFSKLKELRNICRILKEYKFKNILKNQI